ncbi:MAG: DNA polymerase III subunit gamma/tau [Burkholderiaceae bacterium]|nr:DNA polymerase III subunit gamma/tau [Burkholderiaceae bacterium]
MSYVVLARKYRPRSFAQMVGQEHVVQALTNALTQGRLHHAYLFTGTRGIGKTTVSRILAKSLNCTGPDGTGGITATPCGVCQACTEIDADRYIDYVEMDAASNGGKDEIRDLIERAAYKPGVGRFKVFMIDEAHQLSKDAFNALLKTLEEPPEYLKFVLATTDPEKVLPTVLSRCLQFNLRPMAPATVREHLVRVLEAEAVPAEPGALRLLSRAARGSMRDGLSLTDQAIAFGGGRLAEDVVRSMLGAVDRGHATALVEALARRDAPAVLATVDALRAAGLSAEATLDELAQLLQQMAIEQAVPGALDDAEPETEAVRALAPQLPPDETQLLYRMVLQGREELALMSDEHGALAMVLLRFLAFPPAGSVVAPAPARPAAPLRAPAPPTLAVVPAALERRPAVPAPPERAQPRPAAVPAAGEPQRVHAEALPPVAPVPALQAAEPVAPPLGPPEAGPADPALADRWQATVQALVEAGTVAALVRELAWQAGLVAIDTGSTPPAWRLAVAREPLRSAALADKLALALAAHLGEPVQVAVEAGQPTDTPALRDAAERARRQAAAEATIQSDPVVRELLQQFKTARIVPGSIRPGPEAV